MRILTKIKRIIDWLPILWDDNDFDYSSILVVLKYKIKRLKEHLLKHGAIVNNRKYAKQMQKVEDLLESYFNDKYEDNAEKELSSLYGPLRVYSPMNTDGLKSYPVYFFRDKQNLHNYDDIELVEKKIHSKYDRARERDWRKLWFLLAKNMRNWWD